MGCLKIHTLEIERSPLKVVYRKGQSCKKVVQRFYGVDPLAGKFPAWSPYNYALNNPIKFIDPNGMSPTDGDGDEPPVNGLEYFSDDTGEYFWNNKNQSYEHYKSGEGYVGEYKADEFKEPIGNYSIIFDLAANNPIPEDVYDESKTISLANSLYKYLNTMGVVEDISDNIKFPGVKIYKSENMNGAITLGNVIFSSASMADDGETLPHEFGHFLDYKLHFKYDKAAYLQKIGVNSIMSAIRASITDYNHMNSESEMRANILGGAYFNLPLYQPRK
jgi:hypothetical protein